MDNFEHIDNKLHRLNQLGEGSFGIVTKVYHQEDDCFYALKKIGKLDKEGNQVDRKVLMREVQNMKKLQKCQHILKYILHYEDEQSIYILTQYCQRKDLDTTIKFSNFRLCQLTTYYTIKSILKGFSFMHQQNIAYRDFKEDNVMMDAMGTPKIGDFGQSKNVFNQNGQHLRQTLSIGNRFYSAPEVLRYLQSTIGTKRDIWGVGTLLFHLIIEQQAIGSSSTQKKQKQFREIDQIIQNHQCVFKRKSSMWKPLVKGMLQVNTQQRLSADDVLSLLKQSQTDLFKWFQKKYGDISNIIENRKKTNTLINKINPYKKSQRNKEFIDWKDALKNKQKQETYYCQLVKLRDFAHFQVQKSLQWKKLLTNFQYFRFPLEGQRDLLVYLCFRICINELEQLKYSMRERINSKKILTIEGIKQWQETKNQVQESIQKLIQLELEKILEDHDKEPYVTMKKKVLEKLPPQWKKISTLKNSKELIRFTKKNCEASLNSATLNLIELNQKKRPLSNPNIHSSIESIRIHLLAISQLNRKKYLNPADFHDVEYLRYKSDEFYGKNLHQLQQMFDYLKNQ